MFIAHVSTHCQNDEIIKIAGPHSRSLIFCYPDGIKKKEWKNKKRFFRITEWRECNDVGEKIGDSRVRICGVSPGS
jgi:hypothetical protein